MKVVLTEADRRALARWAWQLVGHDRRFPRHVRRMVADDIASKAAARLAAGETAPSSTTSLVVP